MFLSIETSLEIIDCRLMVICSHVPGVAVPYSQCIMYYQNCIRPVVVTVVKIFKYQFSPDWAHNDSPTYTHHSLPPLHSLHWRWHFSLLQTKPGPCLERYGPGAVSIVTFSQYFDIGCSVFRRAQGRVWEAGAGQSGPSGPGHVPPSVPPGAGPGRGSAAASAQPGRSVQAGGSRHWDISFTASGPEWLSWASESTAGPRRKRGESIRVNHSPDMMRRRPSHFTQLIPRPSVLLTIKICNMTLQ